MVSLPCLSPCQYFELICAQVPPYYTHRLFISLWYATFSNRYLVVGVLNNLVTEKGYTGVVDLWKSFWCFMVLFLFVPYIHALPLLSARRLCSQCAILMIEDMYIWKMVWARSSVSTYMQKQTALLTRSKVIIFNQTSS